MEEKLRKIYSKLFSCIRNDTVKYKVNKNGKGSINPEDIVKSERVQKQLREHLGSK